MINFDLNFSDGTNIELELLKFNPPSLLYDVIETVDGDGNILKMVDAESWRFEDAIITLNNIPDDIIEILKEYSITEHSFDGLITTEEYTYKLSECILKSVNIDESSVIVGIGLKHLVQERIE